jgi:5-(carboxyamino)imidazole ribonucleotide mutase
MEQPESPARPLVGVIMGSKSDWEYLQPAAKILTELGVAFETRVVSAHRTPDWMSEYAASW